MLNSLFIMILALCGCRDGVDHKLPAPGRDGGWSARELERLGADELLDRSGDATLIVVALWASWCEPCVAEIPELDAFSRAHASSVAVIGLNTDAAADDAAVQAIFDRLRPSYAQARLDGGEGRFLERLGLAWDGVLPKTLVIARAADGAPGPRLLEPPVTRTSLEAALAPYLEK